MSKMQGRWGTEEGRLEGILAIFKLVFDEIGADRFDAAVDKIVMESEYQFFPSVPEFRGYIARPGKKLLRKTQNHWRDPNCPKCHGGGFYTQFIRQDGTHEVIPCEAPNCLHIDEPEPDPTTDEMRKQRRENPDEFFGEVDVKQMMYILMDRAAKGDAPLSHDEVVAECLKRRNAAFVKRDSKRGGSMTRIGQIAERVKV